ncbi:MAG: DUF6125 family protein [Planctomycetota bacterium]
MLDFNKFSKEELIELLQDAAKNWLAHDGCWFRAVEDKFGMETAIQLDADAWRLFAKAEAKRIMKRHNIAAGSGLQGLEEALQFRMYALINEQELIKESENKFIFKMVNCRVQETRKRKNLPAFPCKKVGLVEFRTFSKTIDPRIETACLSCPPDKILEDCWCAWEFFLI